MHTCTHTLTHMDRLLSWVPMAAAAAAAICKTHPHRDRRTLTHSAAQKRTQLQTAIMTATATSTAASERTERDSKRVARAVAQFCGFSLALYVPSTSPACACRCACERSSVFFLFCCCCCFVAACVCVKMCALSRSGNFVFNDLLHTSAVAVLFKFERSNLQQRATQKFKTQFRTCRSYFGHSKKNTAKISQKKKIKNITHTLLG